MLRRLLKPFVKLRRMDILWEYPYEFEFNPLLETFPQRKGSGSTPLSAPSRNQAQEETFEGRRRCSCAGGHDARGHKRDLYDKPRLKNIAAPTGRRVLVVALLTIPFSWAVLPIIFNGIQIYVTEFIVKD